MKEDIRWKQRYSHYKNALKWLALTVDRNDLDIIQQAGSIQFFEMCSELAWKLLKDYLEEQGYKDVATPRAAIKQAFNLGLIKDGHLWIKLLADRNLTSHVYDEDTAKHIYKMICDSYYPMFSDLALTFGEFSDE